MHRCSGANIIEKGDKVLGQGGHMFCGQSVGKGYFVGAIILKGKASCPKDICFVPYTIIPQQLYCNIVQHIIFLKIKIFWDRVFEVLTNCSRGKLIDMAPHKDFFKLGSP